MNWGFISQKTPFFIVTVVKASNLTKFELVSQIALQMTFMMGDTCESKTGGKVNIVSGSSNAYKGE
jgi:hypothetical protein